MIEQQYENIRYLQFDYVRQFPELIHGVFTRQGGYSSAPYASLNTSAPPRGGGDNFDDVVRNRQLALQALDLSSTPNVTLWQIHSADVLTLTQPETWRTDWASMSYYTRPWQPEMIRQGDAIITQERGIAMALSFADCAPITFYDPVQHVAGIAHGGWRGTARGVVIATVEEMQQRYGSRPQDIYAGIAPAIGPCCYEVSQDVEDLFLGRQEFDVLPTNPRYRVRVRESATFSTIQLPEKESLRLDIQTTNRNQLLMAGLQPEHIEVMPLCTSCRTDLFFSHRKEQGRTGRFVVILALAAASDHA
ncbi:laccase domain protein [Ktedonobacteria bacterium brp13]|nr:laccase domain protein [Ktedonobacteria bacterium brp13]